MSLVIYSKEDLDQIEENIRKVFSKIDNKNLGMITYKDSAPAFTPSELCRLQKIKTIAKKKALVLKFMLPSLKDEFKANPLKLLSFCIGHEGKGSLLSHLISQGLARELTSSTTNTADYFSYFKVKIVLTAKGLKSTDTIVQSFFEYIKMLKTHKIPEYLFEEICQIRGMKFKYRNQMSGLRKAKEVAEIVANYPPEYVNNLHFLMQEYNDAKFTDLLGLIHPRQMILQIHNNEFEDLPLKDFYYQTEYSNDPIHSDLVEKISKVLGNQTLSDDFALPRKNDFIPERFDIVNTKSQTQKVLPHLISLSGNSELFYFPDTKFDLPKVRMQMYIFLKPAATTGSPKTYLAFTMFRYILKMYLKEFLYTAEMAEIHLSFSNNLKGLKITISSYDHKLDQFVKQYANKLAHFCSLEEDVLAFIKQNFSTFKTKRKGELENFHKLNPYKQYNGIINKVVYSPVYSVKDLLPEIGCLSLEEYLAIHKQVLKEGYLETLIGGNLAKSTAKSIESNFLETLRNQGFLQNLKLKQIQENRLVQFPKNRIIRYQEILENKSEKNSLMSLEFQLPQDPSPKYINRVLEKYLSSPYYLSLRSEQQVGYIVFSFKTYRKDTPGFTFEIQSNKYSPCDLAERTFDFLISTRSQIKDLSDEKFEELKEGVLTPLRQDFSSLYSQSLFFFGEIEKHSYNFEKKRLEINEISKLEKADLVRHFERIFFEEQRILEVHLLSENLRELNQTQLDTRGDRRTDVFCGLESTLYTCPKALQKDQSLYKDTYLKREVYKSG